MESGGCDGTRRADVIEVMPWLLWFPGATLVLLLLSLLFIGDGLRDAFDPKNAA